MAPPDRNGNLPFVDRLLSAMIAGAPVGGDKRGLKSAALKICHQRQYLSVDCSDLSLAALAEILEQTRKPSCADFFAALPKGNPR
ncbi:DUF1028 domain-containing protein [Erwinia sp. P7711]|uniref:DUF1028 domain-containing protein n=1 Tax=Erwinia sp. P7711 TaxID=3141451 RepID=UPI003191E08F